MGKKQIKAALCDALVKYFEMQKRTSEAVTAFHEAEKLKQALYAEQHSQGIKAVELWKKMHGKQWMSQGYVKLPDGRIAKIDNQSIFDCEATDL